MLGIPTLLFSAYSRDKNESYQKMCNELCSVAFYLSLAERQAIFLKAQIVTFVLSLVTKEHDRDIGAICINSATNVTHCLNNKLERSLKR